MKNNKRHIRCLMFAVLVASAQALCYGGPAKSVFDQTATVIDPDYYSSNCNFRDHLKDQDDHKDKPPLKKKKKFDVGKRHGLRYFVDVQWNFWSVLEQPDLYAVSSNKVPMDFDYCQDGGTIRGHVFAFGIKNLKNPEGDGHTRHAFIYLPMNVGNDKRSDGLGNRFYLIYMSIADKESECENDKEVDAQCKALYDLATLHDHNAPEYEFIQAVMDKISDILPERPGDVIRLKFHNGVIHGNL
jgi:hypothetical protein